MHIKDYLKDKQPSIYKTFSNAISTNQLSHAYLIVGDYGTPLKETAIYLAKSLLCDSPNPLACENCITCLRIDNNQYADIIIEDGSKGTIKKEDVDHITSTFSKTAIEIKGKVIYIIHLVENMTAQAINALLKFLEEPGKNTYAFLTTENESRVLPTIISRSQRLFLKLTKREDIIEEAIKNNINKEDAELLSFIYNNVENIKDKIQDETYPDLKETLINYLKTLSNVDDALYFVESNLLEKNNSKETAKLFIDLLASFFEDAIRIKNNEHIFLSSYDKIIKDLSNALPHIESSLLEIISLKSKIDLNISIASIFEHLSIYLLKE